LKRHLILITTFIFLGFLLLLHQKSTWGVWFQIEDIHHETFALMSFAAAFGILIGKILNYKKE
jgi:hypothetical protein